MYVRSAIVLVNMNLFMVKKVSYLERVLGGNLTRFKEVRDGSVRAVLQLRLTETRVETPCFCIVTP